jgi:hypothetical protein
MDIKPTFAGNKPNPMKRTLMLKSKRLLCGVFMFILVTTVGRAFGQGENVIYNITKTANEITATYNGKNVCVGNNDYSIVKWYRNGVYVTEQTYWLASNEWFEATYTFNCRDLAPNSSVNISVVCDHYYCVWPFAGSFTYSQTSATHSVTLASYNPVSSVSATDALYGDKVIVTWSVDQKFNSHAYRVYKNGVQVSSDLASGTTSFTHSGLSAGSSGNYTVRGLVNSTLVAAPSGNNGSSFATNLQASKTLTNSVMLSWNSFSATYSPAGYYVTRTDSTNSPTIVSSSSIYDIGYEDAASSLIPGYTYTYTFKALPLTNNIIGTATGKTLPNGVISGTVKTPTNVPVPNVVVKATLQGSALPTDTTTVYTAVTNSQGEYAITGVYYYSGASFTVAPVFAGRTFDPVSRNVTLTKAVPVNSMANFTDLSSFEVSGTILSDGCPMPGVELLLNSTPTGVVTDSSGLYTLTVSTGGSYIITPQLGDHAFMPASRTEAITANTTGIDFADTTKYHFDGYFLASCNTYIGTAQLRVYTTDGAPACFSDTLVTDGSGYFHAELPARKYMLDLIGFTSFNEGVVTSAEVMADFANLGNADLTHADTMAFHGDTLSRQFVFRRPAQLVVNNVDDITTCSGEIIPLLNQRVEYPIDMVATETFNGNTCLAGAGYVVIMENVSMDGLTFNTDTVYYQQGDTIQYMLIPGTPNIVPDHKKLFQVTLFCDNHTDTVSYDVIVLGHNPRSQTFTTVTPQMPFHIIHNPPGDASYAYLEQNSSISNSFTTSFLQEGSVDLYLAVHAGPDQTVSAGIGAEVETEIDITADVTASLGVGVSGLTTDAMTITSTATQRFQTSGSNDMIGTDGDVYVGGAVNLLYALSDALLYDFNTCQLRDSVVLMMEPNGIETTFIYTEQHVNEVIIPELQYMVDYYTSAGDTTNASDRQNQLHVWEQVVDSNHVNIAQAGVIENRTFSGGTLYESSVTTTRAASHSLEMSYYIDYSVAVDLGFTVSGMGLSYGVAVQGRSTFGNVVQSDTETSTTVGYVLSDDDIGDSYSVDIANDSVYGTPVFRLVAGRSSCPWEEGSLHREELQMSADQYSDEVEENDQAVYILQMSNTSESNEDMTYDLIFDHASNPDGAVLTIGGGPVLGNVPYPYSIPAGGSVYATITVSKGPTAMSYNGLTFTLQSQCDDQVAQSVFLNTLFYRSYDLTVAQSGQGSTNPGTGVNAYREGTAVYLYASPAAGYEFQKWVVGTQVYNDPSVSVTMSSDIQATAYFVVCTTPQHTLTMSSTGNGTTIPPSGTHYLADGSQVMLTAMPNLQNAFVKWVIDGVDDYNLQTTIDLTVDMVAEAVFVETRTLSIDIASGSGIVNPDEGSQSVHLGSVVHLFASPDPGFVFTKWVCGGTEYYTQALDITITQDTAATAYFDSTSAQQYQLVVANIGNGSTTPPMGVHYVVDGSVMTLAAFPGPGQLFEKWIIDGVTYTDNPHQVSVSGNSMVDAYFKVDNVGIQSYGGSDDFVQIYPNPASESLRIVSQSEMTTVSLWDVMGKRVMQFVPIDAFVSDIDVSSLSNGTYLVKVVSESRVCTKVLQVIR